MLLLQAHEHNAKKGGGRSRNNASDSDSDDSNNDRASQRGPSKNAPPIINTAFGTEKGESVR